MNYSAELTSIEVKEPYRVPLRERISAWYSNWKNRHVRKAYEVITQAMKDDAGYAESWQANIAVTIYDSLTHTNHELKHAASNQMADRLMKHLFGVSK